MERCPRLRDYSAFIEEIRRNLRKGMMLEDAVDQAMNTCIEQGILADILSKSKMEVRNMLLTEYDEKAEREDVYKRQGLADGSGILYQRHLLPADACEKLYLGFRSCADLSLIHIWT